MVTEEGNAHRRVSLRSECIPIEALGHGRLRCDQSGRRAALAHAKIVIQGCLFAHERHGQTRPRRDNNPRRFARRAINCSADKGQRGSVMVCCWLTLGDERAARRFVVHLDVVPSHRLDSFFDHSRCFYREPRLRVNQTDLKLQIK